MRIFALIFLLFISPATAADVTAIIKRDSVTNSLSYFTSSGTYALLSSQNVFGTGFPGYDFSNCTVCTYFINARPQPGSNTASTLRVQRTDQDLTGGSITAVDSNIWALYTSGPDRAQGVTAVLAQLVNKNKASTNAPNTALNAYAFKRDDLNPGVAVGQTWGANIVCRDETGYQNPEGSNFCVGAEIDSVTKAGAGLDPNNARIVLHLSGGAIGGESGAGVHIGTALRIAPRNLATFDRGIEYNGVPGGFFDKLLAGTGAVLANEGFDFSNMTISGHAFALGSDTTAFKIRGDGLFKLKAYTVSSLPVCDVGTDGYTVRITDALTPTWNASPVGGGTEEVLAHCRSTTGWRVH